VAATRQIDWNIQRSSWSVQNLFQLFVLAALLLFLFNYKGTAGVRRIEQARATRGLHISMFVTGAPPGDSALESGWRYLQIVWPALVFGILISAAVRTSLSRTPLYKLFTRGRIKNQVIAAVAGAPLMLCSCCSAPIFSSVYERTRKAGPALSLTLASPSLNPAALTLSFLVFPLRIASARLAMALILVLAGSTLASWVVPAGVSHLVKEDCVAESGGWLDLLVDYCRSLLYVSVRVLPLLLLGIFASMWLMRCLPGNFGAASGAHAAMIVVIAFFGVLLTLPSFFEIPLALSFLAAGGPAGAAAALLFAGPAINIPSLLVIGRSAGWRLAASVALVVWCIGAVGGLLLG
jgi:uncharacterized membrane protein YraQ (UPF0718 family)